MVAAIFRFRYSNVTPVLGAFSVFADMFGGSLAVGCVGGGVKDL